MQKEQVIAAELPSHGSKQNDPFAPRTDMEVAKRKSVDLRKFCGQDDENAAVT